MIIGLAYGQQVLSTINLDDTEQSGNDFRSNEAGLSFNYSQLQSAPINDYTLQSMIKNSYMYGDSWTEFWVSVKNQVPVGFKYDCTNHPSHPNNANGTNFTCIDDISDNLYSLSSFFDGSLDSVSHATVGYDM